MSKHVLQGQQLISSQIAQVKHGFQIPQTQTRTRRQAPGQLACVSHCLAHCLASNEVKQDTEEF